MLHYKVFLFVYL